MFSSPFDNTKLKQEIKFFFFLINNTVQLKVPSSLYGWSKVKEQYSYNQHDEYRKSLFNVTAAAKPMDSIGNYNFCD